MNNQAIDQEKIQLTQVCFKYWASSKEIKRKTE
jgi:hypothetical protein